MGACKYCGKAIMWRKSGEVWHPFDLDGISHFDTCVSRKERKVNYRDSSVNYENMPLDNCQKQLTSYGKGDGE